MRPSTPEPRSRALTPSAAVAIASFRVPGDPVTKGNMRAFPKKGDGGWYVTDRGGKKLLDWSELAAFMAMQQIRTAGKMLGPVTVQATFYLRRPKRPRFPLPATRPDVDKLSRALLDALTVSGLIEDDGRVTDLIVRKRWSHEPHTEVSVWTSPE